ncbi:MAG: hypothetical protein VB050_16775 [Geobacteraceae bacterium]|nr:hypothetical protein [Geobacteraceae bacterium]
MVNKGEQETYNDYQINNILTAYNKIFPKIEMLNDYFDLDMKPKQDREWSCLTTDFNRINVETINQFESEISKLEKYANIDAVTLGEKYRDLAKKFSAQMNYKVGFSLGISTWTDYLLERTFDNKKKNILIILGHDWYPIISSSPKKRKDDLKEKHPIFCNSIKSQKKYNRAIPQTLFEKNICLFMNLCPDFRPPGNNAKGTFLSKKQYNVFADGFDNLCGAIDNKYEIVGIISWGNAVWQALQNKAGAKDLGNIGIMKTVKDHQGQPFKFGQTCLPYYPFAHPAYARYFMKNEHISTFNTTIIKFV